MAAPPNAPPREPHLLSLKVLRAARPSLVPSQVPYYEDTALGAPALKALEHNSASEAAGHEYGTSGALMLPSTFGTIYLGETFTALLSLSNDLTDLPDPTTTASAPVLKVEMHTNGSQPLKHLLQNVTAPGEALAPGECLTTSVSHEVKELGPHALVCTVTYAVVVRGQNDEAPRTVSRSFRKVYKFQVANPLSVRTKAHSPNSLTATSTLSPTERNKVFLEVQVQNQGEHAMWFERMRFDPIEGWLLEDVNEGLFEGTSALLPPAAVRQFMFVLQSTEKVPPVLPGSSQALGRLDIVWRTPNGEVGRLQTSMLGRRVPLPPTPLNLPAVALADKPLPPPQNTVAPSTPVASPSKGPAPYRPAHLTQQATPPPSPVPNGLASPLPPTPLPPFFPDASGLTFDLTITSVAPARPVRQSPFAINFHLSIADRSPAPSRRTLKLVAQHVQWHPSPLSNVPPPTSANTAPLNASARGPTLTLPNSTAPLPPTAPLSTTSLIKQSRLNDSTSSRRDSLDSLATATAVGPTLVSAPERPIYAGVALPRPFPLPGQELRAPQVAPSREIVRLGPTVVELGEVVVEANGQTGEKEWKMRFVALEAGLMRVGGLRLLLVEEWKGEEKEGRKEGEGRERLANVVLELETVAEVWVTSVGK